MPANRQTLPPAIADVPNATAVDPITHAPYEYHPGEGSKYQLCATFSRGSDKREVSSPNPGPWIHPAGHHCFSFDASGGANLPAYYPQ